MGQALQLVLAREMAEKLEDLARDLRSSSSAKVSGARLRERGRETVIRLGDKEYTLTERDERSAPAVLQATG